MSNCPKCHKPMITMSGRLRLYPDSEPYESGVKEEVDYEFDGLVNAEVCPSCERIAWIGLENEENDLFERSENAENVELKAEKALNEELYKASRKTIRQSQQEYAVLKALFRDVIELYWIDDGTETDLQKRVNKAIGDKK